MRENKKNVKKKEITCLPTGRWLQAVVKAAFEQRTSLRMYFNQMEFQRHGSPTVGVTLIYLSALLPVLSLSFMNSLGHLVIPSLEIHE